MIHQFQFSRGMPVPIPCPIMAWLRRFTAMMGQPPHSCSKVVSTKEVFQHSSFSWITLNGSPTCYSVPSSIPLEPLKHQSHRGFHFLVMHKSSKERGSSPALNMAQSEPHVPLQIVPRNEIPSESNTTDTANTQRESWRNPRSNIPKVVATYWSFVLLGMNDSSYGVIQPVHWNTKYLQC